MYTVDSPFQYDHAFTITGTVRTIHSTKLQQLLGQRFPVTPTDTEREWQMSLTAHGDACALTVSIRHDSEDFNVPDLAHALLTACPDLRGLLTITWPYTELQEQCLPQDLHFTENGVNLYEYQCVPIGHPTAKILPDGTYFTGL